MRKAFCYIFLSLLACTNAESQKISLDKIEAMFSKMKSEGVNTDKTMLWGYFFVAPKQHNFERIKNELSADNFKFVEIFQSDDKNYWLHLERKEIHNAKGLSELNEKLYGVAARYKVTYDGFDVGNVDPGKAIERDTYAVPEDYKAADLTEDNYPYILVGNIGFDIFPHKKEFKYFIKIITSFETGGTMMLPTAAELEKLDEFGLFIEANLTRNKIKNYSVFRDTHKGVRNFYLVTDDGAGATKLVNMIKDSKATRQFDFLVIEDQQWKIYDDMKSKLPKE